jgi:hypothetical protein
MACSGREAKFFLDDFLCEWEALATIRLAAEMGVDGFDVRDALACDFPDVLLPYDIANANDHANLLWGALNTLLRPVCNKNFDRPVAVRRKQQGP